MIKLLSVFNVIMLNKPLTFICKTHNNENLFHVSSNMAVDRYKALYEWQEGDIKFWEDHVMLIIVEHNGILNDGTPRRPICKDVIIKDINNE